MDSVLLDSSDKRLALGLWLMQTSQTPLMSQHTSLTIAHKVHVSTVPAN